MQRTDYQVDRSTSKLVLDGQIILLSDEQVINCTEQIVVYTAYVRGDFDDVVPHLTFTRETEVPVFDIGVHFRNTDKASDILPILKNIQDIWKLGMRIYLATDDVSSVPQFVASFGTSVTHADIPPRLSCGGIHHMGRSALESIGLTKEDVNRDAILDVHILCKATIFIGTESSYFTRFVQSIRKNVALKTQDIFLHGNRGSLDWDC